MNYVHLVFNHPIISGIIVAFIGWISKKSYDSYIKRKKRLESLETEIKLLKEPIRSESLNHSISLNNIVIHERGENIASLKDTLKEASVLYLLAITGSNFIYAYQDTIEMGMASGLNIKVLLSDVTSVFINDLQNFEKWPLNHYSENINDSIAMLRKMKEKYPSSQSNIEIRFFSTEIRNQLVLCGVNEKHIKAWLTVIIPPKRTVDCLNIEFESDNAQDCLHYFNMMWERYENDKTLIL